MSDQQFILVLGDQLSLQNPALLAARPGRDVVVMAEVAEEASYVPHNKHKIALIFAAMRHFRDVLQETGFTVEYTDYNAGVKSLELALGQAISHHGKRPVVICEPGEYRLKDAMAGWPDTLDTPVKLLPDSRFLASVADFASWAQGRKQLRMEYFYRDMRKRYGLLLEVDGSPAGGKWNYDADNRQGWRNQLDIPARPQALADDITTEVLALVDRAFPDNPGDLSQFNFAVTHAEAEHHAQWFIDNLLPDFGNFQDALVEESPWVFHSLLSMYLNIGLLEPLPLCQAVEQAWRDGHCELAAAEGFIRQIIGWREYVRGLYWLKMPDYKQGNALAANRPLPEWFWNGDTDLRCLSRALQQTLDLGYGHHIQRLMVIGNFALLAGLDVQEVCDWYLAVYVDAFEWVELPNTLGMALFADDGIMASKPYAASGKYIQRQGNHCQQCRYNPAKMTGPEACPYNSMYWGFIDRHQEKLSHNPRMGLVLGNWRKKAPADREAIVDWAQQTLDRITR